MTNLLEIDLTSLETALSVKFGLPIKLEKHVQTNKSGKTQRLRVESQNLLEHTGIMTTIFSEVRITEFVSEINDNSIFMTLNLSYKFIAGGSNGHQIGHYFYDFLTNTCTINIR